MTEHDYLVNLIKLSKIMNDFELFFSMTFVRKILIGDIDSDTKDYMDELQMKLLFRDNIAFDDLMKKIYNLYHAEYFDRRKN